MASTLVLVDSRSVKTAAGTQEQTGHDDGKKTKGHKCYIAVDTQDNVIAAGIKAANIHDKPGSKSLEEQVENISSVKKIVEDEVYRGVPPFTAHGCIGWEIVEKKKEGCFKVLPKR